MDKLKSEIILASESIPDEFIISTDEVDNCLSSIKVCKAIGPDAIPNWILKGLCSNNFWTIYLNI